MGKKGKKNRKKKTGCGNAGKAFDEIPLEKLRDDNSQENVDKSWKVYSLSGMYPGSKHFLRTKYLFQRGKIAQARTECLTGVDFGDVNCVKYLGIIIAEPNKSYRDTKDASLYMHHSSKIHLAYPYVLEAAIRGDYLGINKMIDVLLTLPPLGKSKAMNIIYYWEKQAKAIRNLINKNIDVSNMSTMPSNETMKFSPNKTVCANCGAKESLLESTLKRCAGCKYFYYCTVSCAKTHWKKGHKTACRHFGILKEYHRPYANEIRTDIICGIHPKDIPELQTLRQQLGLDRPMDDDFKKRVTEQLIAKGCPPVAVCYPQPDGRVSLGSFPKRI